MTKTQVHQRIIEVGIIPVIRARSAELAQAAARAVTAGGICVVEVTMTVPGAIDLIALLAKSEHGILIGAGTVLDAETARCCLDAGAQFLVSPGFDAKTVALAAHEGVVMMAGGLTPTEVIDAWKAGVDFVKVFPCGNVGGPSYIKALEGRSSANPHGADGRSEPQHRSRVLGGGLFGAGRRRRPHHRRRNAVRRLRRDHGAGSPVCCHRRASPPSTERDERLIHDSRVCTKVR